MRQPHSLTWWLVCSPTYEYTDTIDFYIGGPSYDERDVLLIEARTKTEAKSIAVRHWLADRRSYASNSRRDGENPYAGVTVQSIEAPCAEDREDPFCIPALAVAA